MSDKPLRNFEKFEKGHYYVYTGGKTANWAEGMDAVLDHKIHKCTFSPFNGNTITEFEDAIGHWYNYINGFGNWVEVESPEAVFEEGDYTLRYDVIYKTWKILRVSEFYFHKDKSKNGYDNGVSIYYICKRKSNKKEETKKSKRYLCPHCKSDRTGLIGLGVKVYQMW